MAGRRIYLARLMMATGVPGLIARGSGSCLLVLNYHRIRTAEQGLSAFDDGVFDTDIETFRRQMEWLRAMTDVLDEERLLRSFEDPSQNQGKLRTLVTFDDGYAECFTHVKPVLDELGIRGIFFIPVGILESRNLGWWDLAAYVLKKSDHAAIRLDDCEYPLGESLPLSLRRILNKFKIEKSDRTGDLLHRLSLACGVALPDRDRQSRELMDWDQVSKLRRAGHSIGSHAWSHRPLATLTPEEQVTEIKESKRVLEAIVGGEIMSFAYPVGGPMHYDMHSVNQVRQAGYRQAFSFNTGIATLPIGDRFQIPRESAKSLDILKAKALLPGFMGLRPQRVG